MNRQILLCVETNKQARTDYKYIVETIRHFYINDRKIKYRPIFLESKTKYNSKDKVKEINNMINMFKGQTNVIYFIDVDDYDVSTETKDLFDKIVKYCKDNGYDFVFFTKDIEDVYIGRQIEKDEKVKAAEAFTRKKMINIISENALMSEIYKRHTSNILRVLDLYFKRK